ncbi:hypothetical protein BDA96_10G243400, partial [Sorghum bicolor]
MHPLPTRTTNPSINNLPIIHPSIHDPWQQKLRKKAEQQDQWRAGSLPRLSVVALVLSMPNSMSQYRIRGWNLPLQKRCRCDLPPYAHHWKVRAGRGRL